MLAARVGCQPPGGEAKALQLRIKAARWRAVLRWAPLRMLSRHEATDSAVLAAAKETLGTRLGSRIDPPI